jgi:isoquinoline 1-oxidoreductase beta subunit
VLTYEQRHTSLTTDFSHGLGEVITAYGASLPVGDIGFSQTVYALSQSVHYNFGATTQLLNEIDHSFNTGSMRHIYSPNTAVARELTVDKIAKVMGKDPLELRRRFVRTERSRAVLEAVAERGSWGRRMGSYRAQGLALHNEYHSCAAALVEIDCRPTTVGRKVRDAVTGPRVTRVVLAVDAGIAVNPKGLEAQMMGGIMDGIALVLTSSLHLRDGYFLEASWDNYAYTREWNVPFDVEVIVMPSTSDEPGGAGELGVAPSAAATAAAFARATGTMPKSFPINHDDPLHFKVKPTIPPIPQSPTNGLTHY